MKAKDRRGNERRGPRAGAGDERRSSERRAGSERRQTERMPLELWMEEVSGDDVYFRRTGNVSAGGVYFDRAIPHALGSILTLKFALPGDREMVVARGEVVSAAENPQGLGMGVKFVSIEGDGRERIRGYIRALA